MALNMSLTLASRPQASVSDLESILVFNEHIGLYSLLVGVHVLVYKRIGLDSLLVGVHVLVYKRIGLDSLLVGVYVLVYKRIGLDSLLVGVYVFMYKRVGGIKPRDIGRLIS